MPDFGAKVLSALTICLLDEAPETGVALQRRTLCTNQGGWRRDAARVARSPRSKQETFQSAFLASHIRLALSYESCDRDADRY